LFWAAWIATTAVFVATIWITYSGTFIIVGGVVYVGVSFILGLASNYHPTWDLLNHLEHSQPELRGKIQKERFTNLRREGYGDLLAWAKGEILENGDETAERLLRDLHRRRVFKFTMLIAPSGILIIHFLVFFIIELVKNAPHRI
jgi:hypothetical protein